MHLSNILEIKKPRLNFQLFRQKHAIYLILQPNNKQSESEEFHESVVNYPFLHIANRHSEKPVRRQDTRQVVLVHLKTQHEQI